ncbi:MAG: ureidoglycolate lyase [Pseudomonadota bacterium]
MSQRTIKAKLLTAKAFERFGDVIECAGEPDKIINQGMCGRFHDRADLQTKGDDGRIGLSLFNAEPRSMPYTLTMMERHPLGSQCFVPMSEHSFLVVVADDHKDVPGEPLAFITQPGQAVNYHANTWHGVLTPLHPPGRFVVIDRIGEASNLEEHWFEGAYTVVRQDA